MLHKKHIKRNIALLAAQISGLGTESVELTEKQQRGEKEKAVQSVQPSFKTELTDMETIFDNKINRLKCIE